ncbi:MAG: DegT/DnrJ/EryC1/StrS family aminotransferase [Candidatus Brocadiia bacterium]
MHIKHSMPTLGSAESRMLAGVLATGYLAQGPKVAAFEKAFSRFLKTKGAVAVNSGTSALQLTLLAMGVKPGDEVIIPSYVCTAVLNAVNHTGASPVLVDIGDDYNICPDSTRQRVTRRTKAIIAPHIFGRPADLGRLMKMGVPVIEDCAQSIGAVYKGRRTGSFGKAAILSFYATKMMTTGYGGMVVSGDKKLLDKIRDLREFDNRDDYKPRYNCQMSDLAAGLGLVQLERLPRFIRRRQAIARRYEQAFGFPGAVQNQGVFFRYPVRVDNVGWAIKRLAGKGIEAKRPVYKPLHRYFGFTANGFPMTEKLYESTLSIPIYPALGDRQVDYVIKNTLEILKGAG